MGHIRIYASCSWMHSSFRPARRRVAFLLFILSVAPCAAVGQRALERPSFATPVRPEKYVPGRLLIRFRSGRSAVAKTRAHASVGAKTLASFHQVQNLELVSLPSRQNVLQAVHQYRQNPDVLYAEPDYRVFPSEITPNDPLFPLSWTLLNTGDQNGIAGADIHATAAWQFSTGSRQVVIGLLDTGVDYTHPELAANIYPNSGINVSVNGPPDDPMDYIGHGTHVSGIMGALGNNGLGVAGVNWQVSIIPCKFIDFSGGTTSGAIQCLDYIASFKQQGVKVVATNNSWSGGLYSQALHDAIQAQMDLGILFVAAAGNGDAYGDSSDNDVNSVYPASYDLPNVVAVAATDRRDELASFSNYGRHSVHLGAPGVSVLSTFPNSNYQELSGTSMATPHVTGAAALLAAYNPSLDWIAIKNLLMAGGDPNPNLSGTVSQKRLNIYGAMTCSNQRVLDREEPRNSLITASINAPIPLRVLNIDCAGPAGGVTVTAQPGNLSIPLVDDGNAPDLAANDGIYSATWTPTAYGVYTLTFPGGDVVNVDVLKPYYFSNGPSTYVNITGNYLGLEDERTATVSLPFPIRFGGQTFSTIYVSDNGIITFDRPYNASFAMAMPWIDAGSLVAPFWDDLQPIFPGSNNAFWDVVGTAPQRELVVEWRDVYVYPFYHLDGGTGTFQVVFHEDSDEVDFNYSDVLFGTPWYSDNGYHAGVGIQIGPAEGTQFSLGTASLSNGVSLVWLPSSTDFSLNLDSSSLQAFPNQAVNFTGTATASFGLNSSVTISCSGLVPETCTGSTITPVATGTRFQVQAAGSLAATYYFQIHGASVSPALTHDQPVTLRVVDYFVGTPAPASLNIPIGGSGSSTFNLSPVNGFNGPVALSCSGLPAGASCMFSPGSSVSLRAALVPLTVRVSLGNNTAPGTYAVAVVASTPGAPAPKTVFLSVTAQRGRDFILTSSTPLVWTSPGGSANGSVTVDGRGGYSGTVSLSCSVSPAGPTCGLSKTSIGSFPTTVTVTLGSGGATAQGYQVTVTGTDGTASHSLSFAFDVVGSGVSGPSTFVAYMAMDNILPITITPQSGYSGTVSVSCDVSAFPAGVTCTPDSPSLDFSQSTSLVDNIHIYASPSSIAGTYPLAVKTRDQSGSTDNIGIVNVAIEGFTFILSPPTEQTVLVGNTSAPFDMVLTPLNGYSLPTQLVDWSCNPAGAVCTFDQNPITPNGSPFHIKMSVNVPVNDTQSFGGDFGFTVLAQATNPANQLQMSIPVNPGVTLHVQDFALVPSYSVIILIPGSSFPVRITNQQFNGLNISVALACPSPLPPGVSCIIDKPTLAPGDVATLTFSATLDAPPSFRTFDIVGVGKANTQTIQHTLALDAWISNFALSLDPASISVPSGGDAWYVVEVYGAATLGGDPGALVTCTSPDPGVTCDSPYQVPGASGFAAFAVNVRTSAGVTPIGSHPFTVSVTEWGETQSISGTIIMQGEDSLIVYTPNGGELWGNGTQNISWHYKGNPGSTVKIELLNNGQLVQTITSNAPIGTKGEGFYSWQMPSSLPFSQHYAVRVTSTSNPTITDTSDSRVWMGQGVDLNVPAAGEVFYDGGVMFIDYTWSGYGHVRLDLYKAGMFVQTVADTGSGYFNSGGWRWGAAWQIPFDFTPGSDYTMKIVPVDAPTRAVTSGAFTISKTSITVTAPAGGEIWQPGSTHAIAWNWVGQPVSPGVDVQITLSNGSYVANNGLIVPTTPIGANGSGSFNWTIPNDMPASKTYSVSVNSFSPDNVNFGSTSMGYFAIGNFHNLLVSVSGSGTVQSTDNSIICGAQCSGVYAGGTTVTLTATPAYGGQFTGWSGGCTGTGSCMVTVNSDISVMATFYSPTPDIAITSNPDSMTVYAGQAAQYSLTMTPQGNVTGLATLSCSGLPRASSCSFQPNSFQVTSSAAASTLTISTTARSTANAAPVRSKFTLAICLMVGTILGGFFVAPRNRRLGILLTLMVMSLLVACGGGAGPNQPPPQMGTPAGSYSVQVTVQTASLSKTATVIVNVN